MASKIRAFAMSALSPTKKPNLPVGETNPKHTPIQNLTYPIGAKLFKIIYFGFPNVKFSGFGSRARGDNLFVTEKLYFTVN